MKKYGGKNTIHNTNHIDVETTPDGRVVAVWFRCLPLAFIQHDIDSNRDKEMKNLYNNEKEIKKLDSVIIK